MIADVPFSQECSNMFKHIQANNSCVDLWDCKVLRRRMLHQTFGGVSASGASGRIARYFPKMNSTGCADLMLCAVPLWSLCLPSGNSEILSLRCAAPVLRSFLPWSSQMRIALHALESCPSYLDLLGATMVRTDRDAKLQTCLLCL